MKKKMRYLGWLKNCFSDKKRRIWLGYDRRKKHSILVIEDSGTFGEMYIIGRHDYWVQNNPNINYWHENFWYPDDLEGETVEIKVKKI